MNKHLTLVFAAGILALTSLPARAEYYMACPGSQPVVEICSHRPPARIHYDGCEPKRHYCRSHHHKPRCHCRRTRVVVRYVVPDCAAPCHRPRAHRCCEPYIDRTRYDNGFLDHYYDDDFSWDRRTYDDSTAELNIDN